MKPLSRSEGRLFCSKGFLFSWSLNHRKEQMCCAADVVGLLLCSMTAGKAATLKAAIVEFKASFVN